MAENHQTVDEVGTDETCTACDEDTLTACWGEELDWGKAGESGVRYGLGVRVVDGFGLICPQTSDEPCVLLLLLCGVFSSCIGGRCSCDIVGTEVERTEDIEGDF